MIRCSKEVSSETFQRKPSREILKNQSGIIFRVRGTLSEGLYLNKREAKSLFEKRKKKFTMRRVISLSVNFVYSLMIIKN